MKKLLLRVMGVTLAIVSASPGAVAPAYNPGAVVQAIHQQTIATSTASIASQGALAGAAYAANLQLPSGANGTASGVSPLRTSGMSDRRTGGRLVSVESVPEPSGGAMLLCGLAVLAFIARRKI